MFDVGFWELFLVGLIALIVFGPERLPGLARTVGLWIGRARAAFYSVREEMEREINADGLRETQRALRREIENGARPIAQAPPLTDTAAEQQTPPSQPPIEETTATPGPAPESDQEAHPRLVGKSPLASSKDNSSDADRTDRNAR